VRLRKDCGSDADCFTSLDALNAWINDTRKPSAASPLSVDVGLGEFEGKFSCLTRDVPVVLDSPSNYSGHVTFRGRSRVASVLKRTSASALEILTPVLVAGCQDISFENLTIRSQRYGIVWLDGGSSSWTNVNVEAGPDLFATGWWEASDSGFYCDRSAGHAVHHWFGSKITVKAGTAGVATNFPLALGYAATCGETWFYGGEITVQGATPEEGGPGVANRHQAAVAVAAHGEFQAFGTLLRSLSGPIASGATAAFNPALGQAGLAAVVVGHEFIVPVGPAPGGHFHLHGGNATADASAAGGNATSLLVLAGGIAHTPGASFVANPGAGATAYRLKKAEEATAISPMLWQASTEPPSGHHAATGVMLSDDGADLFVETDCDSDGNCDEGGAEAHLMVMNPARCSDENPWFDVVTGRCRNEVEDDD